jgi:hypothetical protein
MAIEDYIHRVEDWKQKVRELRHQEPEQPTITVRGSDTGEDQQFMLTINLGFNTVGLYVADSGSSVWNSFDAVPFEKFLSYVQDSLIFSPETKNQVSGWFTSIS